MCVTYTKNPFKNEERGREGERERGREGERERGREGERERGREGERERGREGERERGREGERERGREGERERGREGERERGREGRDRFFFFEKSTNNICISILLAIDFDPDVFSVIHRNPLSDACVWRT